MKAYITPNTLVLLCASRRDILHISPTDFKDLETDEPQLAKETGAIWDDTSSDSFFW